VPLDGLLAVGASSRPVNDLYNTKVTEIEVPASVRGYSQDSRLLGNKREIFVLL